MVAKSRSTLRSNIDTFTGDSSNVVWTEGQKNFAINLAIQSSWPEIKKLTRTAFSLTAGSYQYRINGARAITTFTRAPWGPAQVWIATANTSEAVYRELRHGVLARRDANEWYLEFDGDLVDNRDGYQVEVHYEQYYPELGSDSETTEVPEVYINPRALFHLCGMQTLKGHHTDVEVFQKQKPDFYEEAEREKQRHRTEALPRTIKVRWE